MNIINDYKKRRDTYKRQLEKLTRKSNVFGNLRLIIILTGIGGTVWAYSMESYLNVFNCLLITFLVFVGLIIKHDRLNKSKKKISLLYQINVNGIKRIKGEWDDFEETGEEYIDESHNFSWDLDIFGKHSLFHMINCTITSLGKVKLKNILINANKSKEVIIKRQEAVKELSSKVEWFQSFQAAGMMEKDEVKDEKELIEWSKNIDSFYLNKKISLLVKSLPFVSIISILMAYMIPNIAIGYAMIPILVQIGLGFVGFLNRHKLMSSIGSYRNEIRTYEQMIQQFEKEDFNSDYIKKLQNKMMCHEKETASQQIKRLDSIMNMVSMRYMQFYLIFNLLTLWDYQCVIALERWKEKYGSYLSNWLDSLGEMEVLASLATMTYEQPKWVMPTIVKEFKISSREIGHPLIYSEERISNDITFGGRYNTLLITGSNMSGKSTFLRTIGINLVLAYAGAPVCAESFSCPIIDIYTSMRVKDDLDNKISSFYAELLRIKKIIEAKKEGKEVFFLLDEIFKGTNSRDRHTGAMNLIKNLSRENTLGVVSTHDLELVDLSKEENSRVKNYHFQEYYKDDKIFFDYIIHPGVSTTFNAVYLMKQIGIEINNNE